MRIVRLIAKLFMNSVLQCKSVENSKLLGGVSSMVEESDCFFFLQWIVLTAPLITIITAYHN